MDLSNLTDRDFEWSFRALHQLKGDARCRVSIPDTVLMKGGEIDVWYFTAQDGHLKRMSKAKATPAKLTQRLLSLQQGWNRKHQRPVSAGFGAICRGATGGATTKVTRLDREGLKTLYDIEGAEVRGTCTVLQSYISTTGSRGMGAVYRNEFEQLARHKVKQRTYRVVYAETEAKDGKGEPMPAEPHVVKCGARGVQEACDRITTQLVGYIEQHKRCNVVRLAAEYMVDEDGVVFFTHFSNVQTCPMPRSAKAAALTSTSRLEVGLVAPDVPTGAGGQPGAAGSSTDRLLASTGSDSNAMYRMLDKKQRGSRRRSQAATSAAVGGAGSGARDYVISLRSVLLARLDMAMVSPGETDDHRCIRRALVSTELSKLDPSNFYRQVKVSENYYRAYNLQDQKREADVQRGQVLLGRLEKQATRKHDSTNTNEWWQEIDSDEKHEAAVRAATRSMKGPESPVKTDQSTTLLELIGGYTSAASSDAGTDAKPTEADDPLFQFSVKPIPVDVVFLEDQDGRYTEQVGRVMVTSKCREDYMESLDVFDNDKFQQQCRMLCRNHKLCERLANGQAGIQPRSDLVRMMKVMVNTKCDALQESEELQELEPERVEKPWVLQGLPEAHWRRDVSVAKESAPHRSSRTAADAMAEARAQADGEDGGGSPTKGSELPPRSPSRDGYMPWVPAGSPGERDESPTKQQRPVPEASRSPARSPNQPPRLGTAERAEQHLPVTASVPAVTAATSMPYSFPEAIPCEDDLKARHDLDMTSQENQQLYSTADVSADAAASDQSPANEEAQAAAAESMAAAGKATGLFVSADGVDSYRMGETASIAYEVLGSSEVDPAAPQPVCMIFFHDFFDVKEKYKVRFSAVLAKSPPGSRVLLFNIPGQAGTEFDPEAAYNNEALARGADGLLRALRERGDFLQPVALVDEDAEQAEEEGNGGALEPAKLRVLATGNGASAACFWASKLASSDQGAGGEVPVYSMQLFNPFIQPDAHMSLILQNWLNTCDISQLFQFDLQLYFFSHLLFSERYLAEVTPAVAFEKLSAVENSITLPGRATICRGAQTHAALNETGDWAPFVPTMVVRGTDDNLVRASHAASMMKKQGGQSRALAEVIRFHGGVNLLELNAGHELFQECPSEVEGAILEFNEMSS